MGRRAQGERGVLVGSDQAWGNTCVDAPLAEEATFREPGGPHDLPDHVHLSHGAGREKYNQF